MIPPDLTVVLGRPTINRTPQHYERFNGVGRPRHLNRLVRGVVPMGMTTTPIAAAEATDHELELEKPNSPAADHGPRLSPNRRQAFLAVGLGAGALTLAACGSSSTPAVASAATSTAHSAAAPSSVAAAASEAAPSHCAPQVHAGPVAPLKIASGCGSSPAAAPAAAATPAASSPAAASPTAAAGRAAPLANTLAVLSKVPVGGAVAASDANGKPIIIAQPTKGKVVALSAICTHMGCTVAVNAAELDCPCHGSKFNAMTGAVLGGPAPSPLPTIAVEVKNGNVVAG
jgi:cytochrome b6-f complex iron-sulfur subunit